MTAMYVGKLYKYSPIHHFSYLNLLLLLALLLLGLFKLLLVQLPVLLHLLPLLLHDRLERLQMLLQLCLIITGHAQDLEIPRVQLQQRPSLHTALDELVRVLVQA